MNELKLQAKDLNQQGYILLQAHNIDAATEKFNKAITLDPMLIDSYKNLGDLYLHTGEYKEAKSFYKKALLIEKQGEIFFQYGNACFMNDEPHEGLEYYNRAMSAGFDSDEMFFFMGMAYEHMNDDQMALRYIQKAIMKNPSRADYKVKKVSVLLRLNMPEEAKKTIDDMLLNDPELFDGYHMKTMILLEEKKYSDAIKFSKEASDRFPEDAELLYDYANAVALSGEYQEALKIVRNAKRLKYFEETKARFTLLEAEINAELGNMDEASCKCDECISMETDEQIFEDARFMRINLALTQNNFEVALQNAEKLIENNAQNSYYFAAIYFRPYCLNKMGKKEEAQKFYKDAISLYRMATLEKPEAIDAYLYRIMCLKDIEDFDAALELLDFLEELSSEIAEVHTLRADIYKTLGKQALVKEELEKAYQLKPELKDVFIEGGE